MNGAASLSIPSAFPLHADAAQFRRFNSAETLFQLNFADDRPLLAWVGTRRLASQQQQQDGISFYSLVNRGMAGLFGNMGRLKKRSMKDV